MDRAKIISNKNNLWGQLKKRFSKLEFGHSQGQILLELALTVVLLFGIIFWFGNFAFDVTEIFKATQLVEDHR